MKKILTALTILGLSMGSLQSAQASNECKGIYVGKAVKYHYFVKYGDFWLGYKEYSEYADAKVLGFDADLGRATVEIVKVSSGHSKAPRVGQVEEVLCSQI